VKLFPLYVFGGLVVATVAAFFITQHLKVSTPFIGGRPRPAPADINPISPHTCKGLNHGRTRISFYLNHRSDHVDMYVVDASGSIVDQVASDLYMPKLTAHNSTTVRRVFVWNGRETDGSYAPDGTYYFRVALIEQGRTVDVGGPIHVKTVPPHPVITRVTPNLVAGGTPVTIHFGGAGRLSSKLLIYRTDAPGPPERVDTLFTTHRHVTTWNGEFHGTLPPAGTYVLALKTTDVACNTASYPVALPPAPGSTPGAGVTIRYLAAQPPLDPVQAGTVATVNVDSRARPYTWALSAYAARKRIAHGRGTGFQLKVRVPRGPAGVYVLALRSGPYSTAVPIVASAPPSAGHHRMLVVLPTLTWQGQNPVDNSGDGFPSTLAAGDPVPLGRVFANGLPRDLGDEAALLRYVTHEHLGYDLTTDLALSDGVAPPLTSYRGVVFAGTERWLQSGVVTALQAYVQHGGHVLALGPGSFRSRVTIKLTAQGPIATDPTPPSPVDFLGAHRSASVRSPGVILTVNDSLGIFTGTSGAFTGYHAYEPIAPTSQALSAAGPTQTSFAIVGYHYGKGIVVDVGLVGFGSSLHRSVDAQELVNRLWSVLAS
jgi:hypothetical protein